MTDDLDVRALREQLNMTQQQLADCCNVDRATVSRWEQDAPTRGPAVILLRQLRDQASASATSSLPAADRAAGFACNPEPAAAEGC